MLDPFSPDINEKASLNTFTEDEKARRGSCERNKDFYYDRHDKYVETFNIEAKPSCIYLTRPIVDKRTSMLYRQKLVREMTGPAESISFLETLYADNDIDNIFSQADLMSELTGTALLSMVDDESKDSKFRITLWDGSNLSVVPDETNSNSLAALALIRDSHRLSRTSYKDQIQVETVTYQQIWTKEHVSYYQGSTRKNIVDNPYGFIPFSAVRGKEVPNQFYGFSPITSTVKTNMAINQMFSDLAYTIKLQAANPIALMGWQGGEQLLVQPGKAISIPTGGDAKVLEMNPQITETLDTIKFLEQKIYETSSVPEVSIVGSEGKSGRELLVRWYPLVQVFEEKSARFQQYELDAANNFLAMVGLPKLEAMHVSYDKNGILPLDPEFDRIEEDISLNITNPAEVLRGRNPNLTQEEAQSIINSNDKINSDLEGPQS